MSKKILIVDDEPASLRVLRYFLGQEGYEIVGAKDAMEALELLRQSRFDLVLSDVKMPVLAVWLWRSISSQLCPSLPFS
jgi:CheY-like chemotaxis protein